MLIRPKYPKYKTKNSFLQIMGASLLKYFYEHEIKFFAMRLAPTLIYSSAREGVILTSHLIVILRVFVHLTGPNLI